MAGFSFWHLTPLAPIVLGMIGVALNRGDKELARWPFFLRILSMFIVGTAMALMIDEENDTALGVALIYIAAIWILIPYWAASRLRDMGNYRKYWAVLTAVPVIGVFYTLYLLVAASDGRGGTPPIVSFGSRQDAKDGTEPPPGT
ncbi:MAG: hypothetical protein K0Q70_72 [Rhodospirillales bacterium]|jgi:hypothetical protein|nr:hypothetical protein [Rhodospirillales bacterium]